MKIKQSDKPCKCGHPRKNHEVSRNRSLGDYCFGNVGNPAWIKKNRQAYFDRPDHVFCEKLCRRYETDSLRMLEEASKLKDDTK